MKESHLSDLCDEKYRLAIMTTWNIKCGIAEYSKYLANALSSLNVDLIILSNTNPDICDDPGKENFKNNVYQLWKYDNVHYAYSEIDTQGIMQTLRRNNTHMLNIQYHSGFFDEKKLVEFVARCVAEKIRVSITLHNSKQIPRETLYLLSCEGVRLFVHSGQEQAKLIKAGIENAIHIPHGILDFPDEDIHVSRSLLGMSNVPVIGSFGFMRPHKGVLELIEAIGILRDRLPNILLLGLHALYPSEDSRLYLDACTKKIQKLQLQNNVILKTDFMGIETIITHLHAADAIVLPYYESDEGSSATAHMAIAARRPLITSCSAIFYDIKDLCCQVDSIEPTSLAEALSTLLLQQTVLDDLKQKMVQYADDHSWRKISERYLACFSEFYSDNAKLVEHTVLLENDNMPLMNELNTVIADFMKPHNSNLSLDIPNEIRAKLASAETVTAEVKKNIGDKTHGYYFDSSVDRYKHYFSIAQAFLSRGATVLDVGNAPGHVGIGLHLLGMKVRGLNLNDCWRDTYPSPEWLETFHVISHDIEKNALPYDDNMFDAIYFTEVLEHIAIKNPVDILTDFRRVLKPGGMLILSTPNICNISNIFALMNGKNVFWTNDMFYGSLDRHNREYTPDEVYEVISKASFRQITMYGFNCSSNWRSGGAESSVEIISKFGDNHPLLKNTIMLYAYK